MANIKIKRGAGIPSGLTFGELAFDTTNRRLYIGVTGSSALLANTDGGVSSFNGLTGAVTGVTLGGAAFTGLVSSTVGFSGAATNLTGNATGLTAGTASRVQIAEGAGTSYYLALAGGTGNTGIFVDTSIPRWTYNASTGSLITSTGYVEAATLYASTAMYANTLEGFDGTSPLNIVAPYFDGTNQPIYIGDTNGSQNGTKITIDDASATILLSGTNTFSSLANFNAGISSAGGTFTALTRFTAGISASGATFTGPVNLTNTLLINGAQGSSNQVLTSTGSGITWATPSGSGGGITRSISTITTSTSAGSTANTDYVYNGNTAGNITLTLPTAVSNTNRYTVKNSNTGVLSIYTTSSQTIDGVTFYNLNKQYQAIDLLSDNSNWFIV